MASLLRTKIGEFYLIKHLGSGGMADVYLAVNPRSREKRAIKVMAKRATANTISYVRFLREVEIIRGLSHPHIIKLYGSGETDECYFYTMDYMAGGNMSHRLARGRMPLNETISFFIKICRAMAYAHEQGVIHRDLKPANILLDVDGEPMLSDFGIAKKLEKEGESLTKSNEVLGTIAYLAPEQRYSSKAVDWRADIYALGAIFYEVLMGFPPLGKFPWPREIQADFPPAAQAIMEKCLATSATDRYENAGALLNELERCQGADCGRKVDGLSASGLAAPYGCETAVASTERDRIERWFHTLRTGTTRERLGAVRDMVDHMQPHEARATIKLYAEEGDRVRWGLIRVFGELRISAATPLILGELNNPYHRECAVEALGKIGAEDAFPVIREIMTQNPEGAMLSLIPLAQTGKQRAIGDLRLFLMHDLAAMRQTAVRALACIPAADSLRLLKEHLHMERDERVRSAMLQAIHALEAQLVTTVRQDRVQRTEIVTHTSWGSPGVRRL